jgi:hypothetical protein
MWIRALCQRRLTTSVTAAAAAPIATPVSEPVEVGCKCKEMNEIVSQSLRRFQGGEMVATTPSSTAATTLGGDVLFVGLDISVAKFGFGIISVFSSSDKNLSAKTLQTGVIVPPKDCKEFLQRAIYFDTELQKALNSILEKRRPAIPKVIVSIEANIPQIGGKGKGMMVMSQMNAIIKFQMAKRFGSANVFSSLPRSARRGFGIPSGLESEVVKKSVQDIVAKLDPSIQ